MNDKILTRFFGMDPPNILVASMTVYLEDEITESGVGSKGGESIDKRALKKRDYPVFIYPISQLKSVVMDRTGEVL